MCEGVVSREEGVVSFSREWACVVTWVYSFSLSSSLSVLVVC